MKKIKPMKILKLTAMAIFSIILIVVFAIGNQSYSASGAISLWSLPNDGSWYKNNTYFSVSFAHLINYNNVYCIQKNQSFPRQGKYMEVKYKIVINGETAKIYKSDKLYPDSGSLVKECTGDYNNLLAAIICEEAMGLGYGSNSGNYNNSQIALYYYWNDWLSYSGANAYMSGGSSNKSIVNTVGQTRVNNIMEKYKEYASKYLYNATVYYMTPAFNSVQRLLLVERGDKEELNVDIPVTKVWLDGENKYNTRESITVELLANGVATGQTVTLNKSNNWKNEFLDLDKNDENGNEIKYTIKEIDAPPGYATTTKGNMKDGYKITNTLLTEVKVVKKWNDDDDLDEYRPTTLKVTLYSNGDSTGKTVTLDENNDWTATFENLKKYDQNGNEINYTVKEETIAKYETPTYEKTEDSKGYITWTITNTHTPNYDGYIEISGKVWLDGEAGKGNDINGVFDNGKDTLLEGITVRLKYIDQETGEHKLFNSNLASVYETKTNSKGEYTIVVNYDNSKNVYKLYEDIDTVNKKLETAYVEFEYDGMKYTTVNDGIATKTVVNADGSESTVSVPSSEQSKAVENETSRNEFDKNHSTITSETSHADNWTDKNITAATKTVISYENDTKYEDKDVVVKYCNGNGTCDRTNPEGAWMIIEDQPNKYPCENCNETGHEMRTYEITVQKIQNINLGLFKREQPDVALTSNISKVEVEMKGQRYTYVYGVQGNESSDIQTKFQKKESYTYRMPVNPADISYLKNVDSTAMNVYVTYEISVGNLSNTLAVTVDDIVNYYDSNYLIKYSDGDDSTEKYHITFGKMDRTTGTITGTLLNDSQISEGNPKDGYKEITLTGLGITVTAEQDELEEKLYIRYKISQDKLIGLFNDEAPLNNATEILKYSTTYGKDTLYAEQRKGGRTNQPYGGYDYNSHPGNAGIELVKETDSEGKEVYRLRSTKNLVEYKDEEGNVKIKPEDDTDIAPAFVLCKDDEPQVLSGTIWEDIDENSSDDERLGNGKYDSGEKKVENVTVELYNLDGTLAKLYNESNGQLDRDAVTTTGSNGIYYLDGVVTGEYYIKFTYGDNATMDGGTTEINARNYKSTIITDSKIIDEANGTAFKDIFGKDYADFSDEEKKWHITHEDNYSVAVDNMKERLEIADLYYSNYDDTVNMTAYTKPFATQVEFEANGVSEVDMSGNISGVTNVLERLDFGIAERPREDIYAQKTITHFKITLANGQVLAEGNPSDINSNINYTKTMGFRQEILNGEDARNAQEKQVLVEIDTELIQGAQLEVEYAVTITNNNELDYDYGNIDDEYYVTEFGNTSKREYDKYITKNPKANYYYYGDSNGLTPMQSIVEFVDYLTNDIVYQDNGKWDTVNISELHIENNELISDAAYNALNKNQYKVFRSASGKSVTIARGTTTEPLYMKAAKALANGDENIFDNSIEILKIDGKTARTIQESDSGVQIEKTYQPGNYVPSLDSDTKEQDDDRVKIIITPPTGITNYIITYVIATLIGLIIVFVGVVFIKKKVLTK